LEALVTPELAQKIAELSDKVEVVHIDGVGHNIRRENLEAYVSAIASFLRRVYL
jgi:hypothetical protein